MTGQGSETDLVGLIFGSGDQQFDHQMLQDHVGNDTRSNSNFKAALGDAASSNFQGLIRVNKTSLRTDSNLENRNLLLERPLEGRVRPAAGDPEQRRGALRPRRDGRPARPGDRSSTSRAGASRATRRERLVVEAFFEECWQKIPVEAIRDSVWRTVQRKLGREVGPDDVPTRSGRMASWVSGGRADDARRPARCGWSSGVRERLAVCNVDDTFYCIDDVCTHDGAPLDQGELTAARSSARATAPASTSRTAGRPACRPIVPVKTYPVRIENGEIQIQVD